MRVLRFIRRYWAELGAALIVAVSLRLLPYVVEPLLPWCRCCGCEDVRGAASWICWLNGC